MAFENYYHAEQIRRYIIQFMAVFADLQIIVGRNDRTDEETLVPVQIQYGHRDRVVAHIIGEHTQNKLLRRPMMSVYLRSIVMSPELRHGVGTTQRNTYIPRGGLIPDDIKTVRRYMAIPYVARFELSIMTSNTDSMYQILEQILILFDPSIQIQDSNAPFDWTKITDITLEDIGNEENYPSSTDRRVKIYTLSFAMPIYLSAPANVREDIIKKIKYRIGVTDEDIDYDHCAGGDTNAIIGDLDAQGFRYSTMFDVEDLDFSPLADSCPDDIENEYPGKDSECP